MFTFLGLVVGGVVGWFAHEWWDRKKAEEAAQEDANTKFSKDNRENIMQNGKMYKRVGDETSNIYKDNDGNEYERGKDGILRPRNNLNYR